VYLLYSRTICVANLVASDQRDTAGLPLNDGHFYCDVASPRKQGDDRLGDRSGLLPAAWVRLFGASGEDFFTQEHPECRPPDMMDPLPSEPGDKGFATLFGAGLLVHGMPALAVAPDRIPAGFDGAGTEDEPARSGGNRGATCPGARPPSRAPGPSRGALPSSGSSGSCGSGADGGNRGQAGDPERRPGDPRRQPLRHAASTSASRSALYPERRGGPPEASRSRNQTIVSMAVVARGLNVMPAAMARRLSTRP